MRRFLTIAIGALNAALCAYAQKPMITAVLDGASNMPNIAQGEIFIVKGTNLSGAGYVQATVPDSSSQLPASLADVSITFTPAAGGNPAAAFMFYVYNVGGVNQLSALAPSALNTGDYNVTVTYNKVTSAPFKTGVVARKLGLLTLDGTGSGSVIAQSVISAIQYDRNQFTVGSLAGTSPPYTFSPAQPGQTVILWGTGLGKISGDDSKWPGAVDFRNQADIKVIIGTQSITPDIYAGRAPTLPGADVIYFHMPDDVATGCVVPLVVTVDGQASNPTTISIAPKGSSACVLPDVSTTVLASLDQGGTITTGSFDLAQFSVTVTLFGTPHPVKLEQAFGAFSQFAGPQLASATAFLDVTNSCQVFHRSGSLTAVLLGASATNLDAGAVTLNGPNIANKPLTKAADKSYQLSLGTTTAGGTPFIAQGQYALSGAGGNDVGAFSTTVTIGPPLTLNAALPATVNRSQNLTLGWTGGNSTDRVRILGFSGTVVNSTEAFDPNATYDTGLFICTTTAGSGSFTVPSAVLSQLPATPSSNGTGGLIVAGGTLATSANGLFKAPLVKGGNINSGLFQGTIGYLSSPLAYQ